MVMGIFTHNSEPSRRIASFRLVPFLQDLIITTAKVY
jgi:hypothetical protein